MAPRRSEVILKDERNSLNGTTHGSCLDWSRYPTSMRLLTGPVNTTASGNLVKMLVTTPFLAPETVFGLARLKSVFQISYYIYIYI